MSSANFSVVTRSRLNTNGSKHSQQGDVRWWLLGVMALSVLGWLWLRPSGPYPSQASLDPVMSTDVHANVRSANQEAHPGATSEAGQSPRAKSSEIASEPIDTSIGSVTPFGPVVVRTNRLEHAASVGSHDTNEALRGLASNISIPSTDAFRAQLVMSRMGISSGSIDGKMGSQTRAAVRAFQGREGLPITGALDSTTLNLLNVSYPLFRSYTITPDDLSRLLPLPTTWLAKSQQPRLDYESALELVAERFHSHPAFIQQLNPLVNWQLVPAETVLVVPNADVLDVSKRPSLIRISLSSKFLQVFDEDMHLLLHFPCSIARDKEKRPVGELKVEKIAPNPNYTFNPEVFPESEEARQIAKRLILQPGPAALTDGLDAIVKALWPALPRS